MAAIGAISFCANSRAALTSACCSSLSEKSMEDFTWGTPDGTSELFSIRIPNLLSWLSTGEWNSTVEGLNQLQAQYVGLYGPGNYMPVLWITYWAFRWMIGLGALSVLVAVVGLFLTKKKNIARVPRWAWTAAIWSAPLPILAISIGWMFTEMGRQPWIVFSLLKTADAVSPGINGVDVLISLIVFTLVYGVLAVIEMKLLLKAIQCGITKDEPKSESEQLAVAY
ncbi:MAG: cytochrome ubiquinol oxidase subunit I [Micrococcales bacterium]